MFEKEAEEYVMREDVITENDRVPFDNGYGFQTVSFEDEVKKGFKDGAEFGYNKANEWHFVKDGDLPTEERDYIVKLTGGTVDIMAIALDGNLEPYLLTPKLNFYKDVEKWCEIPKEN